MSSWILPIDELIFFKMVSQPPTRYKVSARYQNRAHFWEIGGDVSMDKWGENMGFLLADNGIPSGKRLHSELENHHAIHGKTHYFNGNFQ